MRVRMMSESKGSGIRWAAQFAALLFFIALLAGCATSGNSRDPLEPVNRAIYGFNDGFDRVIAKPIAETYRSAVPALVRLGVSNFFSNLNDIWIFVNNVLQGKPLEASDDFGRFAINSTLGLFGLIDIASDFGLEKHNEDFGQTLGRWGVGSGPYLMLPFIGPSTVRDALSHRLVDTKADFVVQADHVPTRNTLFFTRVIDVRANLLDTSRIVDEAALDNYSFIRDAYLQRRESLIYDGTLPKSKSAELDMRLSDGVEQTASGTASSGRGAVIDVSVLPEKGVSTASSAVIAVTH